MESYAYIKYTNPVDGAEQIVVDTHELQCGGQGDGYCYPHDSFDCIDNLTQDQRIALRFAETPGDGHGL